MSEVEMNSTVGLSVSTRAQQMTSRLSPKPRTLLSDAWRRFRKHRMAMVGVIVLFTLSLLSFVGPSFYVPWLAVQLETIGAPFIQDRVDLQTAIDHLDFLNILSAPSAIHPFGTDDLGRDLLARALYGGRVSLLVGLTAMAIAISLGTIIGATAGFLGGVVDQILMRITDLFLSLPVIPLTLLVVYLFRDPVIQLMGSPEAGIFTIVVTVIGSLAWMSTARIVRATFLSLKEKEFVEAAIALGVSRPAIMFRHILPNAIGPIIVAATLEVGSAIITNQPCRSWVLASRLIHQRGAD
jgi:peptide/nickel transport system permease protein